MDGFDQFLKDMEALEQDFQETIDELPRIVGVIATRFFQENFERQGFPEQGTVNKWKPRLPKSPRNDRPILIDTGTLRDSIRYWLVQGAVEVGVDLGKVPYAQIHNEGGTITITEKMRKFFWAKYHETFNDMWKALALTNKTEISMPKRQYMGLTPDLEKEIITQIKAMLESN